MQKKGIQQLDLVNVVSKYNNVIRRAKKFHAVAYDIPEGNIAGYFPELNPVVPIDEFARKSRTPASKSIVVKLEKYKES